MTSRRILVAVLAVTVAVASAPAYAADKSGGQDATSVFSSIINALSGTSPAPVSHPRGRGPVRQPSRKQAAPKPRPVSRAQVPSKPTQAAQVPSKPPQAVQVPSKPAQAAPVMATVSQPVYHLAPRAPAHDFLRAQMNSNRPSWYSLLHPAHPKRKRHNAQEEDSFWLSSPHP